VAEKAFARTALECKKKRERVEGKNFKRQSIEDRKRYVVKNRAAMLQKKICISAIHPIAHKCLVNKNRAPSRGNDAAYAEEDMNVPAELCL
jgi:hypothetical protein